MAHAFCFAVVLVIFFFCLHENVSYFGRHGHCRTQFCCAHAKRCFADTQTYAKYRVCATVAKSVIQTVYICPILPLIVYVSIHLSNSICTSNREVIKIAQYLTEPPYLSSRNISFNSILARNMNIFWLSLISVTAEDGSEWPTATSPRFCTQLCVSPYAFSTLKMRVFK